MADDRKPKTIAAIRGDLADQMSADLKAMAALTPRVLEALAWSENARSDLEIALDRVAALDAVLADELRHHIEVIEDGHREYVCGLAVRLEHWMAIADRHTAALNTTPAIARHESASKAAAAKHAEHRKVLDICRAERYAEHDAAAKRGKPARPVKEFAADMWRRYPDEWSNEGSVLRVVYGFDSDYRRPQP